MSARAPKGRRALGVLVLGTLVAVAFVLFPLRGRAKPQGQGHGAASASVEAAAAPHAPKVGDAKKAHAGGAVPAPAPPEPQAPIADAAPAPAPTPDDLKSIPKGMGLPVLVSVGVSFFDIDSFDDNKGEFEATTDVRLRWTDLRLRFPPSEGFKGFKEYRGADAEEQLAKMWKPTIEARNRIDEPSAATRRVRIFASGEVEVLSRSTGHYKAHVDAKSFPFDRQYLPIDLVVREDTTDEVALRFEADDVEFSRAGSAVQLDAWGVGLVDLHSATVTGWSGEKYGRATASLFVDRLATTGLAPIFIPLFASLLIPLLALWMNTATEEGYAIDAFELANMGIGGLFSVIALSFAIYSSYPVLASGDNTVTRLFGLNYATLALSLVIVVVCFRYNAPYRIFGRYVNEHFFQFLAWALPLLTLGTGAAILFAAAS